MILKIFNTVLILFAVFMGTKHGWNMLTAKPEMLEMFGKWNLGKTAVMINGAVTLLASVLILFPRTFVWGNFLMAAGILMIICMQLLNKDLKGVAIEVPFLLLNLVIVYLQHPFKAN
ncbi:DoxX family protein [Sphingobacterium yanglingense]|uniref:DoxX-like protein n=1 Tax=Sphingobacterium yanglingense TaxID=1437280 RepID=A0A4R6WNK0_9SPHI|nr:DoxX family protein [Sphingobacterium yanglingense]TDQ82639.1 DoxX-like protein [Sphingobacterium yanglingense]